MDPKKSNDDWVGLVCHYLPQFPLTSSWDHERTYGTVQTSPNIWGKRCIFGVETEWGTKSTTSLAPPKTIMTLASTIDTVEIKVGCEQNHKWDGDSTRTTTLIDIHYVQSDKVLTKSIWSKVLLQHRLRLFSHTFWPRDASQPWQLLLGENYHSCCRWRCCWRCWYLEVHYCSF